MNGMKHWSINVDLKSYCPVLGRIPTKLIRWENARVTLKLWGTPEMVQETIVPFEPCTVSSLPDKVIALEGSDAQDVVARRFDITHGSDLM